MITTTYSILELLDEFEKELSKKLNSSVKVLTSQEREKIETLILDCKYYKDELQRVDM